MSDDETRVHNRQRQGAGSADGESNITIYNTTTNAFSRARPNKPRGTNPPIQKVTEFASARGVLILKTKQRIGTKRGVLASIQGTMETVSDAALSAALRKSVFRKLPLEIIVHLISVMDMPTLFEFAKSCHLMNRLCNDPNLWWQFCVRSFNLRRAARKRSIHRTVNWKLYYLERYTLEKAGTS
jgi:hypothetical protein